MEEHSEEHRPSPPRDAWLLFVLQAAIAVAFAWFIAQIAGLARLTLFEFGITDWILALPVVVLILLGYGAALAALGRAAAYDEKRRLRSCYWPQAVAGLMWSVLIALFTAAAPFYGEEPGAREIFRQVLIFIPVFLIFSVFLFFVLMRGPRWD